VEVNVLNTALFVLGALLLIGGILYGILVLASGRYRHMRNRWGTYNKISWVIPVALLLGLLLVWLNWPAAWSNNFSSSDVEQEQQQSPDKNAAAHPVPCNKIVGSDQVNQKGEVFPTDSHQSWQASVAEGKRHSGDSMSPPFPATDDSGTAFRYWEQLNCTQPYIGLSTGSMLATTPLGDGQTIGEITGLTPANAADIKPAVVTAYDSSNTKHWSKYQAYAAKVNAVLNVAQIVGIEQSPVSIYYWHFANNGVPDRDGYNTVVVDEKENLPALVLRYRNKGATCELARVGINVVGPMPERFKPEGCTTPTPTTSTKPAPPTSTHPGTHTPPPPPTTTKPPSRTTTPPTTTRPPTTHTTPPKTCLSEYGPGYSGTYPDCHKDGSPGVQPTQPPQAPGPNPQPDPEHDPGSHECYDPNTGAPLDTCS
jgi:hypothetical protein